MQIRIKKGLNIPVAGTPEQSIHPGAPVAQVALSGQDYVGIKPRMLVDAGDRVTLGQPLFIDKRDPAVPFTSPGGGKVVAVNRGARRRLETVVIELDDTPDEGPVFDPVAAPRLTQLDRPQAVARLIEAGLWTAFRTRPYSRVPRSDGVPRSIFVTAIDTQPLAPDPRIVIAAHADSFDHGLSVISKLTDGRVFLCTSPDWEWPVPDIDRLEAGVFDGPHPAGLVGTHIHYLDPVGAHDIVWHVGYQDVIAIGKLFTTGRLWTERIVALGGEAFRRPRLVSTRLGASITDLVADELNGSGRVRVVSGSLLSGRHVDGHNTFLGRYHNQISVIGDEVEPHILGWLGVRAHRYTATSLFLRRAKHASGHSFTSALHGRVAAMLPLDIFEKVLPLDILPSPLLRALMVRDTDQAQALGCLELDEEDLALCSFVCPAKSDYGMLLRANLEQIEKEG
jgi:Na+-transporting NADH:ubiquinone oxidoreductase subunit A